jgi:hypothetical protein
MPSSNQVGQELQVSVHQTVGATDHARKTFGEASKINFWVNTNTQAVDTRTEEEKRNAIVETARKYIGTNERDHPKVIEGFSKKRDKKVKKGKKELWCADFVLAILEAAGISTLGGHISFVPHLYETLQKLGRIIEPSKVPPKPGDIVFLDGGLDHHPFGHVAIVEKFDPKTGELTTIDGNSKFNCARNDDKDDPIIVADAVRRRVRNIKDADINAFARVV